MTKKILIDEAVVKQTLEALESRCGTHAEERGPNGAITVLREALEVNNKGVNALAEPQAAEPVAWVVMNGVCDYQLFWSKNQAEALADEMQKRHDLSGSLAAFHVQPLYTHPAVGDGMEKGREIIRAAHGITSNQGD